MVALPRPGTLFADKYVIESQLGGGTAGVVLSATHKELRQRVAIKVLRDAGSVASERMIREARAALALQSEHVVRVMDVGRDAGRVFLVMEQLDGSDLATVVKQRKQLPISEAVDYVLQACAGVAEAHARGVVHRDLKPSNLFLTRRADGSPFIKVLDFGLSKSNDGRDSEASLTGPVEVLGSPMYMSPEQVRGAKLVDHRTDIWALGVIVFRLLTGRAPFGSGLTVGAALASVVADEPVALHELLPEVPGELEAIVARCLQKSPDDRFPTVADLATALAPFGTDDGRASVVRLVRDRRAAPVGKRPRWPLLVWAGVIVVALAGLTFTVLYRSSSPVASAASTTATPDTPFALVTIPSSAPAPPPAVPPVATRSAAASGAPAPHRSLPRRSRPPSSSSVVKSAATDDRY